MKAGGRGDKSRRTGWIIGRAHCADTANECQRPEGWCLRSPVFTLRTNMDDAIEEPKGKNAFLFKKRKIRSNVTRKRKEADGSDGEASLINDRFKYTLPEYHIYLSDKTQVLGYASRG